MGKGDELIQYIAARVTEYVDHPDTLRERRAEKRMGRQPWQVRWFGMLPFALGMWLDNRKKARSRKIAKSGKTEHKDESV